MAVGRVQAQDEEPPPVANLKCEARTDQVRFSWDIPQWSGGEIKWYDVVVTLPNGNRFSERRHRDLRSRTDRGKWQPGSEARIEVKALYDLPNGDRETSAAGENRVSQDGFGHVHAHFRVLRKIMALPLH